jgi:hypothetical protein
VVWRTLLDMLRRVRVECADYREHPKNLYPAKVLTGQYHIYLRRNQDWKLLARVFVDGGLLLRMKRGSGVLLAVGRNGRSSSWRAPDALPHLAPQTHVTFTRSRQLFLTVLNAFRLICKRLFQTPNPGMTRLPHPFGNRLGSDSSRDLLQ